MPVHFVIGSIDPLALPNCGLFISFQLPWDPSFLVIFSDLPDQNHTYQTF